MVGIKGDIMKAFKEWLKVRCKTCKTILSALLFSDRPLTAKQLSMKIYKDYNVYISTVEIAKHIYHHMNHVVTIRKKGNIRKYWLSFKNKK